MRNRFSLSFNVKILKRCDRLTVNQWNRVNSIQQSDPLIYGGFAGAFASFFETGDPNAHKVTNDSVSGVSSLQSQSEFVIGESGFSNVDITQFKERCDFWRSVADKVPI